MRVSKNMYLTRNNPRELLRKIAELENKQSEFIGWLEYVINNLDSEINQINGLSENLKREKERATIKYNVLIQIMKKYKEIIYGLM